MFRRRPRHDHMWEMVGAVYTPGRRLKSVRNVDTWQIERIEHGFTTVTQRCTICRYVDTTDHTGKIAIPEGFRWKQQR